MTELTKHYYEDSIYITGSSVTEEEARETLTPEEQELVEFVGFDKAVASQYAEKECCVYHLV